jgi:hypothetical protein
MPVDKRNLARLSHFLWLRQSAFVAAAVIKLRIKGLKQKRNYLMIVDGRSHWESLRFSRA